MEWTSKLLTTILKTNKFTSITGIIKQHNFIEILRWSPVNDAVYCT